MSDSKFPFWKRLGGVLALIVAPAAAWSPAAAGMDLNGFLRTEGEGDIALSWVGESYDEFWRGDTKVAAPEPLGEVSTRTFSLWTAYGVRPRLSLFANIPRVDVGGDGADGLSDSGLQDLSVVAAYRLGARSWTGSGARSELVVAGGLRTPLSDYEANAPVSLGDGTTDALLRFVHLYRLGAFYWSQQVGYDARGGEAPDGWPLFTELGRSWGRATVGAYYSYLIASSGTDIGDNGFTFPGNREEYERVGAKAYFEVDERFGITAGTYTTLNGRNTGDSSGLWVGLLARY